jgi:hypothetical protein
MAREPPGATGRRVRSEGTSVEMAVGIALIILSALLIAFIVRTVQSNMA